MRALTEGSNRLVPLFVCISVLTSTVGNAQTPRQKPRQQYGPLPVLLNVMLEGVGLSRSDFAASLKPFSLKPEHADRDATRPKTADAYHWVYSVQGLQATANFDRLGRVSLVSVVGPMYDLLQPDKFAGWVEEYGLYAFPDAAYQRTAESNLALRRDRVKAFVNDSEVRRFVSGSETILTKDENAPTSLAANPNFGLTICVDLDKSKAILLDMRVPLRAIVASSSRELNAGTGYYDAKVVYNLHGGWYRAPVWRIRAVTNVGTETKGLRSIPFTSFKK